MILKTKFLFFMLLNISAFALGDLDGKVTDNNTSNPLSGATVLAYRNSVLIGSDTTDGNGDYLIQDIKPGQYIVVASKDGYETESIGVKVNNNVTTTVNFALETDIGEIAGQVTEDSTGDPINNAAIDVYQGELLIASTTTNSLGNYSISNLSAGDYIVVASKASFETDRIGATVVSSQITTTNFSLIANPGSISGNVKNTGLSNIEDAAIIILQDNNIIDTTTTDASGNYTVSGLASGSYEVVAIADTYQAQIKGAIVTAPLATTVNFTLASNPGTISGQVTDQSNNPIASVEIDIFLKSNLITSTLTDSSGNYEFTELAPNDYIVVAKAENFQIEAVGATVISDQITTVNFSLIADPGIISGTVTATVGGVAIQGAIVSVFEGTHLIDTSITDSVGHYQITELPPSSYTVVSNAENFQLSFSNATVVSNQTTILNFSLLADPGTISGTVTATVGGAAIESAHVLIFNGTTLIDSAITDSSGNYEFTGLAPSSYNVIAVAENFQLSFATGVAVLANQTTDQDFSLDANPGTLSGTVTDLSNSNPIAGAEIDVFDGTVLISSAVTDSSGNYQIEDLPSGTYTANAIAVHYVTGSSNASITAGDTTTLDFILTPIPNPPETIFGEVIQNRFLTQTDRVHRIKWTSSNSDNIIEYKLKRDGSLLKTISANSLLQYDDHNRNSKISNTYSVSSINSFGEESSEVSVTLK